MKYSRRNFLRTAGTGVVASGLPLGFATASPAGHVNKHSEDSFKLAVAGYTFLKFNLDQSLAMMQRTGVHYLGVKSFHLPLDSSGEVINEAVAKMKAAGVEPYGVGPISMKTNAEVDGAFAYARQVGVKILVGVPSYELLPYVEGKVKEYDIRLAIHNHGPDTDLYPSPENIWKNVKALDPRMGICMDIGHTTRLGLNCTEEFLKYHERIFDMHIWDVDISGKKGKCVESGRGIIDFPAFIKTLRKEKYTGTCSLEYWKDKDDPLAGIAESMGYFRGVMAGLV